MKQKTIALAYSGGLDTSFCIPYLREQGFEVHAVHVNTGGFNESEIAEIMQRAADLGAVQGVSIEMTREYFEKCVRYLLFGNVLRNNTYPLSVSSERPFQAMALLRYCRQHNIRHIAHGSTGAGNDQIRFDLIFQSLAPDIRILTPIRDTGLTRSGELQYLQDHGHQWDDVQKTYSYNFGIWGTSVGGKETLTSDATLPETAYPYQRTKQESQAMNIGYDAGLPVSLDGKSYDDPVALIHALHDIAAPFAIGRDIHVGDTIIGIKGRVGFAAPAPVILLESHALLEKHVLTKWQMHWKHELANWYGMMLHEGHYLEPVMRQIEAFLTASQAHVMGVVRLILHPYRLQLVGVESPFDLMNPSFGSYGEENRAWTGEDARGFTRILSNASKIYYHTHPGQSPL